jgi:hypothetical protein
MAEARAARIREAKAGRLIRHTLDPLLRHLTAHYVDDADLTDRLQRLFKVTASCPPQLGWCCTLVCSNALAL